MQLVPFMSLNKARTLIQNNLNSLYFLVSHQLLTTIYVLKVNIEVRYNVEQLTWMNEKNYNENSYRQISGHLVLEFKNIRNRWCLETNMIDCVVILEVMKGVRLLRLKIAKMGYEIIEQDLKRLYKRIKCRGSFGVH